MIDIDTGTDEFLCRIEHRVGVITLNKPQKKNALGDILTPAFRQTLLVLEDDERVGCVMITGSGDAFVLAAMSAAWVLEKIRVKLKIQGRKPETIKSLSLPGSKSH